MTASIEDVSSLPGQTIVDQMDNPIGKITGIYAMEDGYPMWVAVDASTGLAGKRSVLIPLARIKDDDGRLHVPYSKQHILEAPEVEGEEELSAERDHELRGYYGIDTGDQELRDDNKSYAALVSENGGEATRVDDPEQLETPDADKRSEETLERLRDPGSSEARKVTAEDVAHDDQDVAADDQDVDEGD
jgi:PRC-barrel domain